MHGRGSASNGKWPVFAIVAAVLLAGTAATAQQAASSASEAGPSKGASLSGVILTDVGEKPIANAEVVIQSLNLSVRSDSAGRFRIAGIPAGQHQVVVRNLGYEPYASRLTFRAAQHDEVDFLLREVPTKLKEVAVKGEVNSRYAIRLAEFEERRKFGMGKFLTSELFEQNGHRTMDVLLKSKIAGLQTAGKGFAQVLKSSRSAFGGTCTVQIILNGVNMYNGNIGQGEFDINSVPVMDVIGFEYYTVATTPLQYRATSGSRGSGSTCGTAVIWTK